jgi:hypothetical protein
MNQFFSFKRFNFLVSKHWADNKKRYGLTVLAFIGVLIVWFLLILLMAEEQVLSPGMQESTFFFLLFAGGTFYASQYFRDLVSRPKGGNFLLVPASTFEKFLCSLLYTAVLFLIVFTAAFYLVDFLMVAFANSISWTGKPAGKISVFNLFKVDFFRFNSQVTLNFLLFFFSVQSVFLLGSVYFKRYSFLKTVISGFIIGFLVFAFAWFLYSQGLVQDDVAVSGELSNWKAWGLSLAAYAFAPILWTLTYFCLKAKQV